MNILNFEDQEICEILKRTTTNNELNEVQIIQRIMSNSLFRENRILKN
jgi:hypothetical protein